VLGYRKRIWDCICIAFRCRLLGVGWLLALSFGVAYLAVLSLLEALLAILLSLVFVVK
jgi:hypothetical protein